MMNEALDMILNSWVQIIVAAVLVAMFIFGYKRGLIRMSVSVVSMIASIVVTKISLSYVLTYVNQNEKLKQMLTGRMETMFGASVEAEQGQNEIDVFYELIGMNRLTEYIGEKAADLVITILTFLVMLVIISILVRLIFKVLDLIASVPGLSFINRVSGGVLGFVEGLFYIWIAILIVGILPESHITIQIAKQFNDTGSWLYYLKEANLITRIFEAMLGM